MINSELSEQQANLWQPLTFDHLLSKYSLANARAWMPLTLWVLFISGALTATIMLLPKGWLSLSGTRMDVIHFFLFNPALVLGMILFFWFGFEWGFIPVFLCSFIIAFHSNMPWGWSLIFGISFVMGLAICAMAYQGFRVPYDLRSLKSVVFYVSITFIASIASSMGAFIWSFTHQLTAFETIVIWKSWWSGTFLQGILITGPLILLFAPSIERMKARYYELPERQLVSMKWIFGAVASITGALALFVLSGKLLGKLRVLEVMSEKPSATVADIVGALESFEIISWISIGIIVVTGYGAINLITGWNKRLSEEVRNRTRQLNKSQEELEASLEEKKLLLKEIHHRVKNNMALVSALLELQQNMNGSDDPAILQTTRSRIRSMAMAHEALYQNETFSAVSMKQYIEKIGALTHRSFSSPGVKVDLQYKLQETNVELSKSIPLGLLINEILINAFKHAFKDQSEGTIWLESTVREQRIILTIRDNGTGLPKESQAAGTGSLGMLLIRKLSKQLKGDLSVTSTPGEGTCYTLAFAL